MLLCPGLLHDWSQFVRCSTWSLSDLVLSRPPSALASHRSVPYPFTIQPNVTRNSSMAKFLPGAILMAALAVAVSAASSGVTPLCGVCGRNSPPCVSGTTCEDGLCKNRNNDLGQFCDNRCSLCGYGMVCTEGQCYSVLMPGPSRCGDPCSAPGYRCQSGLTCSSGVCMRLILDFGYSCGKRCEGCKEGLFCLYGVCSMPWPPVAPICVTCSTDAECEPGAFCYESRCVKFVVDGEPCNENCYLCYGLPCNRRTYRCTGLDE
jgi:hypothetical protein